MAEMLTLANENKNNHKKQAASCDIKCLRESVTKSAEQHMAREESVCLNKKEWESGWVRGLTNI